MYFSYIDEPNSSWTSLVDLTFEFEQFEAADRLRKSLQRDYHRYTKCTISFTLGGREWWKFSGNGQTIVQPCGLGPKYHVFRENRICHWKRFPCINMTAFDHRRRLHRTAEAQHVSSNCDEPSSSYIFFPTYTSVQPVQ